MNITKISIIVVILTSILGRGIGQNNCGYVAGFTCSTAPIICDLNCLNGFEGTLYDPNSTEVLLNLPNQPKVICTSGGKPQNMSWFAFIAGSNYAKITITPFNCQDLVGIQVGMFGDCDFTDDLDKTMWPVASEYIDCEDPQPAVYGPLTLESSSLIAGQTYYFYVDGNKADICSYRVTVDQADQADNIPDLNRFDQSNDTLSICPKTKLTLGVASYPLEIKYYWKVKSPGDYYNYSTFTNLDTQVYDFVFDSLGTYEVSLYAYNGCDETDTIKKVIIVKPFEDEKFSDVIVCANRFPYAGPQNEDPNGDGIQGWLGPNIMAEGLYKHNVFLASGCEYDQEVNVRSQSLQSAERITLVDCAPFDFHGYTVSQTVSNIPITIVNADKNGCDSLITLDAHLLNLEGNLQQQGCSNNTVTVTFNNSLIAAPSGYQLSYKWKDALGNALLDADGNPATLIVQNKTEVYLTIDLTALGKTCSFDFAPIMVDPIIQLPVVPIPNNWDVVLCEGQTPIINYAVSGQSGNIYTWTVNNGAIISGTNTGSNINVDITNMALGQSASLCVKATNGCGNSQPYCLPIIKLKKPIVQLANASISVCEDSIIILNHNVQNPLYEFKWELGNANVLSGNTSSAGPIMISYGAAGKYQVDLTINDQECVSDKGTTYIDVIPNVDVVSLNTESYSDKIIVKWNAITCASNYEIYINDILFGKTTNTDFTIGNLAPSQLLKITVKAAGDGICACGLSSVSINASTLTCNEFKLNIDKSQNKIICEDAWATAINLTVAFSGTNAGLILWSGKGITDQGIFTPENAKPGINTLFAQINDKGCIYKDSIIFNLVRKPDVGLVPQNPVCADDLTGSIEIKADDPTLSYYLDGDKINVNNMIENVAIGVHLIEIFDINQCKVIKTVEIDAPVTPIVEFLGTDMPIYDNESVLLTLKDINSELNLIDSIEWFINGELYCSGDCRSISFESMEGGVYNHQVLIYYKNCVKEEAFDFVVKEAPKVYFSNILYPNASNESNKYFTIQSNDADLIINEVKIFSRWGELVFHKNNFTVDSEKQLWDGKMQGKELVPGVYVLQISYVNEKGVLVTLHKDITLLR